MTTKARLGISVCVVALGALLMAWVLERQDHGHYAASDIAGATNGDALRRTSGLRVFFAHQSVGNNIIGGLPSAYGAAEADPPQIIEVSGPPAQAVTALPPSDQGFFAHTQIGVNGDPVGKLEEFDSWMRAGMADRVDVALIKLCYIDFAADTDAEAVFQRYEQTVTALERDYPDVNFVAATTPLTTEPGLKTKGKALLGGNNPEPRSNAVREHFNTLLRERYGDRVFDVAAFESTAPDGSRIGGTVDGQEYFALYDGYARDEGHLDDTTSAVAAARLVTFLADQAE